jgi:NAD(P)-dependent dehydrogenase (short-subunit alcohol dehydrogenase family)
MTETADTTTVPLKDLTGWTALVTGATSGIGRAAAVQLGRQGADVVAHGRDQERGAQVLDEIAEVGGTGRFLAADLGEAGSAQRLATEAGNVDILVNNAGFSWFGPTVDLDEPTLHQLFAANVYSAYLLVAALAPKMAAQGRGVIINLSSMAGTIGLPGAAAYSATKAALSALTRSWAAEYASAGIRVNTVAPGPVYTSGALPERITALGETTLLNRAAQPDEIGELIGFLASPRAAYITGALFPADGGRTAI